MNCGECGFFKFLKLAWFCKFHKQIIKKLHVGCKEFVDMNFKPGMK